MLNLYQSAMDGQSFAGPLAVGDAILARTHDLLRKGDMAPSDADKIIAVAKQVWDKYVVGYNFPNIPDVFENLVKRLAWEVVEKALRSLIEHFTV